MPHFPALTPEPASCPLVYLQHPAARRLRASRYNAGLFLPLRLWPAASACF